LFIKRRRKNEAEKKGKESVEKSGTRRGRTGKAIYSTRLRRNEGRQEYASNIKAKKAISGVRR
jgi:hypothetical protein